MLDGGQVGGTEEEMELMTIGAFAELTRLSPKALRLYDRLGLLSPAEVDPANGYRFYSRHQVPVAELVALLRRVGMPLDHIAAVLDTRPDRRATVVGEWWSGMEAVGGQRRSLTLYIQARLIGGDVVTS